MIFGFLLILLLFFDFSRYDLYTKTETVPDIDELWPYYQSLIDKYCPKYLEF